MAASALNECEAPHTLLHLLDLNKVMAYVSLNSGLICLDMQVFFDARVHAPRCYPLPDNAKEHTHTPSLVRYKPLHL
jgi:hypothetical protein